MILECFRTGTGIRFRKRSLEKIGVDQDRLESSAGGQLITERVRSEILASEDALTSALDPVPAPVTGQQKGLCRDDDFKGTDIDQGSFNSADKTSGLSIMTKEMSAPTGSVALEPKQERKDALSPIYDQLNIWKVWWFPEFLPLRHRLQSLERSLREHYWSYVSYLLHRGKTSHISTVTSYRVNIGRPRRILKPAREGEKILVHRTVDLRMKAEESELGGQKYRPRAEFDALEIEWVD